MSFKDLSNSINIRPDTREEEGNDLVPQKSTVEPIPEGELELYILNSLQDDAIQERIKTLLQEVMRDELSKMSVVLREAVRNWVFKEKQKYHLEPEQQPQEVTDKLEKTESDRRELEAENQKLKRALELKEHENKIMLSAIKKMTPKPN